MAKLSVKGVTYSATIVVAALYVICRAAFWIWPQGTAAFFNNVFHGMDIAAKQPALVPAIIGFAITVVGTAVIAAIFTLLYNKFAE